MSIIASGVKEIDRLLEGEVEFVIMSPNSDVDDPNYRRMISETSFRTAGPTYRATRSYILRTLLLMVHSIREFARCDMIIDMRGEGFATLPVALAQSAQMVLGAALGKPYVIYAQSIGPIRGRVMRFLANSILSKAELVTLREEVSMDYFRGLSIGKNAELVSDQAVLLEPSPPMRAAQILNVNGFDVKSIIVGVSPIPQPHLVMLMASMCDHLVESYGASVVLIPHAVDQSVGGCRGNDDLKACEDICSLVENKGRVRVLNGLNAAEAKSIMRACQLYVTCRWHAGVASLSTGTPTVVLTSKHKSAAMRQFGTERYLMNPDSISVDELQSMIDICWEEKTDARSRLESRLPSVRSAAMVSSILVVELIKRKQVAPVD